MLFDLIQHNRIVVAEELKAFTVPDVIDRGTFSFEVPPKRKLSDYLKSATGWVYSCASVIADEVAQISFRLMKPGKADDEVSEIHSHPILDLLHRANPYTTKFDLVWLTQQYLELTGEAPWFIAKNDSGKPVGLYLLRPDRLKIVPAKDNKNIIDGYRYQTDDKKEVTIKPDELVFLKYPDPASPWRGKGTLEAAARTVDVEDFSEEWNRKFFYNSARPDSIFRTDKSLTKEQRAQLNEKIKQNFQGLNNAHKTMVLEAGLDWKPMQLTQKDMDFLEQQRFGRDKILGIFRVPRTAIGITDDVNRANAEATDYVFARRTIKPKMQRLVEMLNEFLVPMFDTEGTGLFLVYDDPVPRDMERDARINQINVAAGVKTINEVRSENGDEPVDGGDVPYISISMMPLGSEPTESVTPPAKGYGPLEYQGRMRKRRAQRAREVIAEKIYTSILPMIRADLKAKADHGKKNQKVERFEIMTRRVTTRYEVLMRRRLAAVMRTQKNQVLSKIPTKGIEDEAVLNITTETEAMVKIFSPILFDLMGKQGEEALRFVGKEGFDPDSPRVREYLRKRTYDFSFEMNTETNRRLGRTLADGVRAGESIPQLRRRISSLFDSMENFRSERIARSEVIRASSFANIEAYKQSGVVDAKEWLTAFDERTCPYCEAMNGKKVNLDESFFAKGDSIGSLVLDYEDVDGPPLHPSCRCTLIPVIN